MRKSLLLLVFSMFILFSPIAIADDDIDYPFGKDDLWENWESNAPNLNGSKDIRSVSDEEFDKAIQQIKDRKNKFGKIFKKNPVPKGEEFSQSNETEILEEQTTKDTPPVICVPIDLHIGESIVPIGHYQVKGEKDNGQIYINLYQSQYLIAKFPAIETSDDFDNNAILFSELIPIDENNLKIIYGSIDFNAYSIIKLGY